VRIVLDPGHGGEYPAGDPGAVGPGGIRECDINLQVALKVKDVLAPVVEVFMTRTENVAVGDERTDLKNRVRIAGEAGANLFISIHCNSAADPSAKGCEILCYPGSEKGKALAAAILSHMIPATGLRNRGIKERGDLYVLKATTMPAVLLEVAFISNPDELAKLISPDFQTTVAVAIAQGIAGYLGLPLSAAPSYRSVNTVPDVNGVNIDVKGTILQGFMVNISGVDYSYGPVRAIVEALGFKVEWDEETRAAKIR
jgi:N-acetylmuramoyl-L-alanine amidase